MAVSSPDSRWPSRSRRDSHTATATLGSFWALHAAALALDDEALRRECASLAERTARLRGERLHVVDGGLCHGGAGLAHIFQRLYRDTANEVFADAARDWLDSVCSQRDRSAPFGFTLQAHKVTDTGRAGLLFGVSGIALTLMSALDLTDVAWDAPILG